MKSTIRHFRASLAATVSTFMLCPLHMAEGGPPIEAWGREVMQTLDHDLWLPDRRLYAEKVHPDRTSKQPAFMWGVGVQLTALAAAAQADPKTYKSRLRKYADAIDIYWNKHQDIEGYDVLPEQRRPDRYYDDNAWIVLAMIEIHEVTGERKYLQRAEETYRFVMSGEDGKLGGGLYWRENELKSKNTCTNAPAIVSALRLYQLTEKTEYMKDAERLHRWMVKHLRDADDGLFWDNIRMDGSVDRRKFSYNSALMIRANLLFHEIKEDKRFLTEAQRIARSAESRWVRENGGIADDGRFAHLLVEALLMLHAADGDDRWVDIGRNAMVFAREHLRDPHGRYPKRWDRKTSGPIREVNILDQASVARALWMIANAKNRG